MKKIFAMVLCIILMLSLSVTAFAAGTEVTLTPSATSVTQGENVTFSLAINGTDSYKSMSLTFKYDSKAFEIVKGEWKVQDSVLADVNTEKNIAAVALKAATNKAGEVFTFVLKAKADAEISSQTVSVDYVVKNGSTEVAKATATKTVKITCKTHTFGDWKVTTAATCDKEGKQERTCTACGFVESKTDKALGHKYGAYAETKAATCTDKGVQTATCSVCKKTTTKAINALGHDVELAVVTEATATTEGLKEGVCKTCGETISEVIPVDPTASEPTVSEPDDTTSEPDDSQQVDEPTDDGNGNLTTIIIIVVVAIAIIALIVLLLLLKKKKQ